MFDMRCLSVSTDPCAKGVGGPRPGMPGVAGAPGYRPILLPGVGGFPVQPTQVRTVLVLVSKTFFPLVVAAIDMSVYD